jgi:hypothetical protein
MIVRLRFDVGPPVKKQRGKNRHLALAAGALLAPAALMAYVLGVWRLAADLGLAGQFALSGILAHWQLWMGAGAALQFASYALTRYGLSGRLGMPSLTSLFPVRPPAAERKPREASVRRAV